MTSKKVKIKVKKRKINFRKIFLAIIIIILITFLMSYYLHLPVKNIYVTGNNILSDKEIISICELDNYPPYVNTFFNNIKEKLLKNDYIKNVYIKRKMPNKIYIEIEEYKPLAIYNDKLILSSKKIVDNTYNIDYVPYIVNNIDNICDSFISYFSKINDEVLLKISHIEYVPNEVDSERFLLYMVDSNYVYITLTKIDKINKYNSIVNELDNKKGIIYLDSGDYVEIKG
jgi:cell division protein FtsQ